MTEFYDDTVSFYQPPTTGQFKLEAPLKEMSHLTIGYGSVGQVPQVFVLPPGQNVEVGFLKLFLTTVPVDYSNIPQCSPFDLHRGPQRAQLKTFQTWDTINVVVVHKKDHPN